MSALVRLYSNDSTMQIDADTLRRCWFLAGPTACGKSSVGLALNGVLAERGSTVEVEIISLDSMALYRGMDVGTAKPSADEQRTVPHHLIDVIDPHEEYSLAKYVEAAEAACRDILGRNHVPLFVGGTGLYLRGLLRGVFDGPPADWDYRHRLQEEAASNEPDYLHGMLRAVDPATADSLHPNDTRRIIRALEVHYVTGRPISQQQQQRPLPESARPRHVLWLAPARDWLYQRINKRVEAMIDSGLVEEVKQLLTITPPMSRTARQALGYKEVIEHIEHGLTLEETIERIQTRTRQFAKRQFTWFRNLQECSAIDMTGNETPRQLAETFLDRVDSVKVDQP